MNHHYRVAVLYQDRRTYLTSGQVWREVTVQSDEPITDNEAASRALVEATSSIYDPDATLADPGLVDLSPIAACVLGYSNYTIPATTPEELTALISREKHVRQ